MLCSNQLSYVATRARSVSIKGAKVNVLKLQFLTFSLLFVLREFAKKLSASNIKSEVNDVTVRNRVIFALKTPFTCFLGARFTF